MVPHRPERPPRRDWPSYTAQALRVMQWPREERVRFLRMQARMVRLMSRLLIGSAVLGAAAVVAQVWAWVTGPYSLAVVALMASLAMGAFSLLAWRWLWRDVDLLRRCTELHERREHMRD